MWATPLTAPPERTKATFIEEIKYKLLLYNKKPCGGF